MSLIGQGAPHPTGHPVAPVLLAADLRTEHDMSKPPANRVNWLFSGIVLGTGSWLLVLGVIFAAFGIWTVASGLFGGLVLCLLLFGRGSRRLRRVRD